MKNINYQDIISLKLCDSIDVKGYFTRNWSGTLLNVLSSENIPNKDRIWLVTRFLPDRENHLFMLWCAENALNQRLMSNLDPRSIAAIQAKRDWLDGKITIEQLDDAASSAWMVAHEGCEYREFAWSAWFAVWSDNEAFAATNTANESAMAAQAAEGWDYKALEYARGKQIEYLKKIVTEKDI